jgi:hypothetical protein
MASLDRINRRRNLLGKAGACCCLFLFLALVDGLVARFREPPNIFKVLPGQSVELNGPLEDEVQDLRELTYRGDHHLLLTFSEAHKGYFLGGDMWRGRLQVAPDTKPGVYFLTVGIKGKTPPRTLPPYRIMVFADPRSLRQSHKSLIQRAGGLSPWAVAPGFLPAILLCFGGVFLLSQKKEKLLAALGRAEIYRVQPGEDELRISFGLGTEHGVHPGSRIEIHDDRENPAGVGEVQEVTATDAVARVPAGVEIKPGYIVSLRRD